MDYSRYHSLSCERQDQVLIVSLNRPEAFNAINAELHTELSHVLADMDLQTFYVKPYSCGTARRRYAPYKLSAQTTLCRLSCSM